LLAEGWTPAHIAAASPAELRQIFAARGCRLSRPLAGRIIARAAAALPIHPAATAAKPATLAALLGVLETLDRQIAVLEAEMTPLLAATQGAKLPQIRGVATVAAAGFVAFVGHTGRRGEWSKVWPAAGLDPARSQSGVKDASLGSAGRARPGAAGDPGPGRWRLPSTRPLQRQLPGAPAPPQAPKVALAAVGNQIGRTCFALMASGGDYDPYHQAKPTKRPVPKQPKAGGQAA
jgi:hypothetical protein